MNIQLLSPIYLFGILGISIPILVHLLTRRQQTRIKFSAVYLLLQSQKRSIKRSRPNRLMLLLIRCLAIACLSFALSRPLFSFGAGQELISFAPSANVFVLDDSFSMSARSENSTLYEKALEAAEKILGRLPEESAVSWVSASKPGHVKQNWTSDLGTFLKRIKLSSFEYKKTDIGPALKEALVLFESTPQKTRHIYLLTDLDKNGWVPNQFPHFDNLTSPPQLQIIDLSEFQTEKNRAAIKSIEVHQEFLTDSRIIRVNTEVLNLRQDKTIQNLRLALWANGQKKNESLINIPPGSTVEKGFSFPGTGNERIEGFVEIEKDGLEADNRRYFSFNPDRKLKTLLVDGDPRTVAHQSETFYLERALNPFYSSVSDIEPTVSTLSELPSRNLNQYSVVMLCNVRELPVHYELELEKFVLRGGSLLVTLGDQIDPKFYNERFGNLLPVEIESLNQVGDADTPFNLNLKSVGHPVFKTFDRKVLNQMEEIRFHSLYSVRPRNEDPIKVPVRFKNEFPAVVESSFGKGRVLLFVSSIDRDWNNFPIQPTFLPWIQRWVKYSARSLETLSHNNILVGETFELDLKLEEALYIQTPENRYHILTSSNGTLKFTQTNRPGVFTIFRSQAAMEAPLSTSKEQKITKLPQDAQPISGFSANVDVEESNPEKISKSAIQKMLPALPFNIVSRFEKNTPGESSPGVPLATPGLLMVALALFWEGWLVRRE